jgi:D-xylonolactonase
MLDQLIGQAALVGPTECQIGENPLWHPEAGIVFFLDISAGTIFAYTPATGECRPFSRGRVTGGMVLQEDSTLLLFQDGCISVLGLDGVQRGVASGLCPSNERFNDVIADPEGRVFVGALGGSGRLFRIDTDGTVTEVFDGFEIPNGMGFTDDTRACISLTRNLAGSICSTTIAQGARSRIGASLPKSRGRRGFLTG